MKLSLSPQLLLVAIWAGLLVTFMVLRPPPSSVSFWLCVGSAMLFGGLYMVLSRRESRRTAQSIGAWQRRVDALVDVRDDVDDGHLAESLDDAERRRVIEELERMPRGSRSLRRALSVVSPELLDRTE